MLDSKGFDLWANGYDESVSVSDEDNAYPFAGYKRILGRIYELIMQKPNASVLDVGFGTATLTTKLYENGCVIYGQVRNRGLWRCCRWALVDGLLYCLLISITFLAFINKAKTIGIITIIIMAMGMAVLGYLWFTSSM